MVVQAHPEIGLVEFTTPIDYVEISNTSLDRYAERLVGTAECLHTQVWANTAGLRRPEANIASASGCAAQFLVSALYHCPVRLNCALPC